MFVVVQEANVIRYSANLLRFLASILMAKLLIQELWKLQRDWNESLPSDVFIKWSSYVTDVQYLRDVRETQTYRFGMPRLLEKTQK